MRRTAGANMRMNVRTSPCGPAVFKFTLPRKGARNNIACHIYTLYETMPKKRKGYMLRTLLIGLQAIAPMKRKAVEKDSVREKSVSVKETRVIPALDNTILSSSSSMRSFDPQRENYKISTGGETNEKRKLQAS